MIINEDVPKPQAPRGHWFRTMKARQAIREMQKQLAQTQLTVFYRHLFFTQEFLFQAEKKKRLAEQTSIQFFPAKSWETFMQHQSWSLSIGQIRATTPTEVTLKGGFLDGFSRRIIPKRPNKFRLWQSITPRWIWTCNCKPYPPGS